MPNMEIDPDPKEKLQRLVAAIHARMAELRFEHASDSDATFIGRAWLRSILAQAAAVSHLSNSPFGEAAIANIRTMFETWANLRYLLLHGDRTRNARKAYVNSLVEFAAFLTTIEEDRAPVIARLDELRKEYPDLVTEVEAQRKRGQYHWSGMNRTRVIEDVGTKLPESDFTMRHIYKVLSWDAHGEMSAIRDVRMVDTERGQEQHFAYFLFPEQAANENAEMAGRILAASWGVFATSFGLSGRLGP
jgi:hypothetical protein